MTSDFRNRDFVRNLLLIHVNNIERRAIGSGVELLAIISQVTEPCSEVAGYSQCETGVEGAIHVIAVDNAC